MNTIEQYHEGAGDNVSGDKYVIQIKALAPNDLQAPIEQVLESVRQRSPTLALAQLDILRQLARKDDDSAALVEALGIYTGLADNQDSDKAWCTIVSTASTTKNLIVKDICLAALLKLAYDGDRAELAADFYQRAEIPGSYATEAWLRDYANEGELRAYKSGLHSEGVLTGAIAGAFRLQLPGLMLTLAKQLQQLYPSRNQRIVFALAAGFVLNTELMKQHFWLSKPEIKAELDDLSTMIIPLLDEAGEDLRVQELACSIIGVYQYQPGALLDALRKNLHHLNGQHSKKIAWCKLYFGDASCLLPEVQKLHLARTNPQQRREWCQQFLVDDTRDLKEAGAFLHLAQTEELVKWLAQEKLLNDATDMEEAYVRLAGDIFLQSRLDDAVRAYPIEVETSVNQFVKNWSIELSDLNPDGLFELAARLCTIKLPQSGLKLIAPLIPDHALWASPGVLVYLRCLLDAEQYSAFAKFIKQVEGGEQCMELIGMQAIHAERTSNFSRAIQLGNKLIELAPEQPYPWSLQCHFHHRYCSLAEQQALHARIPSSVLQSPTNEVQSILFFMTMSGDTQRAEERWVEWMSKEPDKYAVDLVNFYLGLILLQQETFTPSFTVGNCLAAIQYRQEDDVVTKLIVDDAHQGSRITLAASSDLAKLLLSLKPGESANQGVLTYSLDEHLPPFIACIRIATAIRHERNDGSDDFYSLRVPTEPEQLIPFLQQKLALSPTPNEELMRDKQLSLYMRGHVLSPLCPLSAAITSWTDRRIAKPTLPAKGDEYPKQVVLDAYGIAYLAVTGHVKDLLQAGISFILSPDTKETLVKFYTEFSDENYLRIGLTETGDVYRITGADVHKHDAHLLAGLRLLLESGDVIQPVTNDTALELLTLKQWLDTTVYDAMTLSAANQIPWLCMDEVIAGLHYENGYPLANTQALVHHIVTSKPLDFEQRRYALLLYANVKLPIPINLLDLHYLATTKSTLAGFILFKIIQNHGQDIFSKDDRHEMLLTIIYLYLANIFRDGHLAFRTHYSPGNTYTSHVFNHGIDLYISLVREETAEQRLAKAAQYMCKLCVGDELLLRSIFKRFKVFAWGRFIGFSKNSTDVF